MSEEEQIKHRADELREKTPAQLVKIQREASYGFDNDKITFLAIDLLSKEYAKKHNRGKYRE